MTDDCALCGTLLITFEERRDGRCTACQPSGYAKVGDKKVVIEKMELLSLWLERKEETTPPIKAVKDKDVVWTTFPHCDSNVLHAPGACEYCDDYPKEQQMRVLMGINFTGEHDSTKKICPSEISRNLAAINRWPGNRAHSNG